MPSLCYKTGCDYARRGVLISDPSIQFCPNCGCRLQSTAAANTPPQSASSSKLRRGVAFAIDWVLVVIAIAAAEVPVIGSVIAILGVLYLLFRDINGASPGKAILGLVVLNRAGGPSTATQRILRNLPFAVFLLPAIIPAIGPVAAGVMESALLFIEAGLVLFSGERIGDRFAGTKVALRGAMPPQYFSAGAA